MVRVLHLCSVHADLQTTRSLNLLSSAATGGPSNDKISSEIVRIGPAGDFPNLASATLALRSRQYLKADILHAWGPLELAAAALAGFDRIIFSPPAAIPARWHKWLRLIYHHRPIHVVLVNPESINSPNGEARPVRATVIPPGVAPPDPSSPRRNESLRAELGVWPEDFLVLAPGESTRAANHKGALWAIGILYTLSDNYRIVTWGRGEMSDPIARLSHKMGQRQMLVRAEQILKRAIDFDSLLTIADAAAVSGQRDMPMLPTLMCMAAGLPIAAYRNPLWNGILQPNVNALVDDLCTPRTLGQCLMDLRADPALRQKLGQAARKTAVEQFSIEQFLKKWGDLYQEIADQNPAPQNANKVSAIPLPFSR
jgi:glycosyltransferase involved in cell wall biosynthesis